MWDKISASEFWDFLEIFTDRYRLASALVNSHILSGNCYNDFLTLPIQMILDHVIYYEYRIYLKEVLKL